MDRPNLEQLYSMNNEIKRLVSSLLDGLDQQQAYLSDVVARLAASRSTACSSDRLLELTVDAYGIVVEVRLADDAFSASTPERLARSITEVARAAARQAQQRRADILTPITETVDSLPDLPDLFPGAPSLREIRDIIDAAARTDSADTDSTRPNRPGHSR
ncbi:YbaB/EbfC family nucleoid-associated protein [Nocardia wallacei]|uniref:YbaB/EbfC family nucleoid-associated protein n=1 Tax=Nocardia wallacei TaxID=480035 RepID=UPI002454C7BF|nr:YbaB/EbfC family nucleoid-associated protein [Nocardia wallacei]